MSTLYKFQIIIFLAIISALVSCKPEPKTPVVTVPVVLDGDWEIAEAYKGNTLSRLLDNGTFKFTEDRKFSTNILRDTQLYPYSITGGKISIDNPSKDTYIVQHKTSDTLILGTRLRNFDFKFITIKAKEPE